MKLPNHEEQLVAGCCLWVKRQLAGGGRRFLADDKDVGQRQHERESDVRCREQHRDIGPLDSVEEVRLCKPNELEKIVLFREWHPIEQRRSEHGAQEAAQKLTTLHQCAHARSLIRSANEP